MTSVMLLRMACAQIVNQKTASLPLDFYIILYIICLVNFDSVFIMLDLSLLLERVKKAGLFLPITFNLNDKKRLAETKDEAELVSVYETIQQEISKVSSVNRSINHSNHSL